MAIATACFRDTFLLGLDFDKGACVFLRTPSFIILEILFPRAIACSLAMSSLNNTPFKLLVKYALIKAIVYPPMLGRKHSLLAEVDFG